MRSLFWFTLAVAISLICLQLYSGQRSSTATVDIRPTPQSPLPSKALLPQVTPALPKVISSQVRTPTKKQARKVIGRKHPPKTPAKRKKSKEKTNLYIAPAIEIRVAVAQNVSNIALASSTAANIIDGNGQRLEQLPHLKHFKYLLVAQASHSKKCSYLRHCGSSQRMVEQYLLLVAGIGEGYC